MTTQENLSLEGLVATTRRQLVEWAEAAGSWGYHPGTPAQLEPTVWALFALAPDAEFDAVRGNALNWVEAQQRPGGEFGIQNGYPKSIWPTAFATLALAHFRPNSPALPRAVAWLTRHEGQTMPETPEIRRDFDIDPSIPGWSWTERSFAWVEPTAWVILALKAAGLKEHARVRAGLRLLRNRAYDEGGINYGNRRVFGKATEPVPADTAAYLLAFADEPDEPKLAAARRFLLRHVEQHADLENLCWAKLALQPWRESDTAVAQSLPELSRRIATALAERQRQEFFAPSIYRLALAATALGNEEPFRHGERTASISLSAPPKKPRLPFVERLGSGMRGLMISALSRMKSVTVPAVVHVARAASYEENLAEIVWSQYAAFRTTLPLKEKRVVLKPNLVEYHPNKVINTDPRVVAAAIELCQREGAREILVAEGPGHWRNVEFIVNESGLGPVLRKYGVPFVDLNHDAPVETANLGRCTPMEYLYLAKTVVEADVLISLPKMKTHHWAGVTLSLKNLFGTMPGQCYGWPKNELHWHGIDKSIVDIALTRGPDLAIVDGIVGMEGDGPLNGEAKQMGVLVMGADPLAVDSTCCRLMGLIPEKVPHLELARQRRVGVLEEGNIAVLGLSIAEACQSFEPHPKFISIKKK